MSDGIPTGATPGPRIVVTGAAGFIGKRCVAILRSTGAAPLAIAHRWAGAGGLDAALGDERIDHALHLGWYAAPHDYLHNRAGNQASLEASLQLSAALRERGGRHHTVAGNSA